MDSACTARALHRFGFGFWRVLGKTYFPSWSQFRGAELPILPVPRPCGGCTGVYYGYGLSCIDETVAWGVVALGGQAALLIGLVKFWP